MIVYIFIYNIFPEFSIILSSYLRKPLQD